MRFVAFLFLISLFFSCDQPVKAAKPEEFKIDVEQGTSLLGTPLVSKQIQLKDSIRVHNYLDALETYEANDSVPENLIWLGRRMAYLGNYKAAIKIFTEGITNFPEEARFFRHRGHRYITLRQLDKAIADLEKAVELIKGTEDVIEPDGIPNRMNRPVSSLHTNIYYHLGLAYYLQNDLNNAQLYFEKCLEASKNNDMIVASKHWLYMIYQRTEQKDMATSLLENVRKNMNIIENESYHQLLLFYKGELTENELAGNGSSGSSEAVQYGIANWNFYNGNTEKAQSLFENLVATGNWAGFGYIAAEADLSRM